MDLKKPTFVRIVWSLISLYVIIWDRASISGKNKKKKRGRKMCNSTRINEERHGTVTLNKNTIQKTKTLPRLVNLSPGTHEFLSSCLGTSQRLIYTRRAWNKYLWSLFVCTWKIIKNMALRSRLWEKEEWSWSEVWEKRWSKGTQSGNRSWKNEHERYSNLKIKIIRKIFYTFLTGNGFTCYR